MLVRKEKGEYRLCIDYRALNKITVRDRYPLPRIDDQIGRLAGKTWFTNLNLKDRFHHVIVADESIKYTAFNTPDGHYEYVRMPFGLVNAPSVFQRFLSCIFRPLLESGKISLYLDDVLIAMEGLQENLKVLEEVLKIMAGHRLELRLDKCIFGTTR